MPLPAKWDQRTVQITSQQCPVVSASPQRPWWHETGQGTLHCTCTAGEHIAAHQHGGHDALAMLPMSHLCDSNVLLKAPWCSCESNLYMQVPVGRTLRITFATRLVEDTLCGIQNLLLSIKLEVARPLGNP